MTEFRSERESLLGTVERRAGAERLEFREDKASGEIILQGYAATFQAYDVHGGPSAGGWVEKLSQRSFDETLADQPDVQLLINHTGTPLARTKSGTLKLTRDNHGLRVWASLDPTDPDVQALVPKMRRGDMDEMSFAFRVTDQTWDATYSNRTINSLSLEKGDVSVVNYGMNPTTKVVLADAVGMLSQLSNKELAELRSQVKLDGKQVKRAAAVLQSIAGSQVPPGLGSVKPAGAVAQPVAGGGRRASGSDDSGAVAYADPGYKEGKKRYPINNRERAKAAWSYINMPKNQKGYTSSQVKAIKGRIKSALTKFGVDVGDGGGNSATSISHIDQVVREDGSISLVAVLNDGAQVHLPAMQPQRALPPADQPQPDAAAKTGGSFKDEWYGEWNPNDSDDSPADPHDVKYEVGPMGLVNPGPIPDNIMGGGNKFVVEHPSFKTPSPEGDPHDVSFDTEEQLSMDHHDDPYDFGPYSVGSKIAITAGNNGGSGGDPHSTPYAVTGSVSDRPVPAIGGADPGRVADNDVTNAPALGAGSGVNPGTPPCVGTEPVDDDGEFDWTSGTLEPGDPSQELDHAVRNTDPHDTPLLGGPAKSFRPDGSWEPTNIEGGSLHHDVGQGDEDERVELDLGMAEALEKTIIHCYKLAEGNAEVRKTLAVARKQLHALAGWAPKPAGPSEIQKKMAELRAEVGDVETGSVGDYLKFIRSAGTAPIGYGGLLDHDPDLHITTPSERLARESLDKDRRARQAAKEADKASERLKAAQREAQLNDAIRRHRDKRAG